MSTIDGWKLANAANAAVKKISDNINAEDIIRQAAKLPVVKVDREKFLRKELSRYYPANVVNVAIENNPAYAGVTKECVKTISKQIIDYETNKVSALSFAAGLPGWIAMPATIPADVAQYFGFMVRTMQELAYLYGFPDFGLTEDEVPAETMNQVLLFLGVMVGVQGANAGVKFIADAVAQKVLKTLPQRALTKGVIYPIVKKVAQILGVRMTKQIFAEAVSMAVPVVGGVVAGAISYFSFKPSAKRLRNQFEELPLCDPYYYKTK